MVLHMVSIFGTPELSLRLWVRNLSRKANYSRHAAWMSSYPSKDISFLYQAENQTSFRSRCHMVYWEYLFNRSIRFSKIQLKISMKEIQFLSIQIYETAGNSRLLLSSCNPELPIYKCLREENPAGKGWLFPLGFPLSRILPHWIHDALTAFP